MKIATLFSGIGAPEQGAKRVYCDFETVFACEFDKFARQSYEANYDLAPEHFHCDVHDMDATQYKDKVDILIGGSPCQAFSIAGLRHGTEDTRGQLIYQYIRVVEECLPPVIVYENVKGMMSIDNGNTIKEFVQALREIGYHCHYSVVNTKDYGVPQNRERIFLVGFLDVDVYHRFDFASKVKLEKRLKDVLEDDVNEKYYLSDKMLKGFQLHNKKHEEKGTGFIYTPKTEDDIAVCLRANAALCPTDNTIKVVGYSGTGGQRGNILGTEGIASCLAATDYKQPKQIQVLGLLDVKGTDQIRRVYGTDGIAATLTTMQGGNQEPKIVEEGFAFGINNPRKGMEHQAHLSRAYSSKDRVYTSEGCSPTIMAQETQGRYHTIVEDKRGQVSTDIRTRCADTAIKIAMSLEADSNEPQQLDLYHLKHGEMRPLSSRMPTDTSSHRCLQAGEPKEVLVTNQRIRKLTPRECLRLQDFPDTFKIEVSDSQAYKQAGNSMSVNILEMIFNQIEKAKKKEKSNSLMDFI